MISSDIHRSAQLLHLFDYNTKALVRGSFSCAITHAVITLQTRNASPLMVITMQCHSGHQFNILHNISSSVFFFFIEMSTLLRTHLKTKSADESHIFHEQNQENSPDVIIHVPIILSDSFCSFLFFFLHALFAVRT